jgi:signal transduction histidine kinase
MLQEFLTRERNKILEVARKKATEAKWAPWESSDSETQWSKLYDRFAAIVGRHAGIHTEEPEADDSDESRLSLAVSEIVQTYSLIYRAITECATEQSYEISTEEYRQLNLSLDTAIADVVNDFEQAHSAAKSVENREHAKMEAERLGFLVHELRNSLQSATLAFEIMETGVLDPTGSTGGILKRSLLRLGELIDKALIDVRLRIDPELHLEHVCAADIVNEVGVTAGFLARTKAQTIRMQAQANPSIVVDKGLLVSAVSNLMQNALKFTPAGGTVKVRTRLEDDQVIIEVEDECGGLDEEKLQDLFVPGKQLSADRSGLGLGLTITRQSIERNGGAITVTNLPGKGCIFALSVPLPKKE